MPADRTPPPPLAVNDIVGAGYKQTLDYTSGQQVEIHMLVKGRADDHFACKIQDGSNVDQRRGAGQVLCRLVTLR